MLRAVLDTNVLISALLSPGGTCARILARWIEGRVEIVACPMLLEELATVLERRPFEHLDAGPLLEVLSRTARIVPDPVAEPGLTPDPDDDYLIALAREARADAVVTGDAALLGIEDPSPRIVSPRAFLEALGRLP